MRGQQKIQEGNHSKFLRRNTRFSLSSCWEGAVKKGTAGKHTILSSKEQLTKYDSKHICKCHLWSWSRKPSNIYFFFFFNRLPSATAFYSVALQLHLFISPEGSSPWKVLTILCTEPTNETVSPSHAKIPRVQFHFKVSSWL